MLNHLRTLLANLPPTQSLGDTIAEEPIPLDFAPLALPSFLVEARRVLFGADPDRSFVNYRMRQFMTLLHGGRYVDHVTALDPRVAYATKAEAGLLSELAFRPVVTPRASAAAAPLPAVTGAPAAPDASGRMRFDFTVTVLAPNEVEVRRVTPYPSSLRHPLVLSGGLSADVPLTGAGYSVRLRSDTPGLAWGVEVLNRPQRQLGQLVADLDALGEESLLALFGPAREEPYATFAALWRDSGELPDRLTGALLAVGYRTEEVRLAGGAANA